MSCYFGSADSCQVHNQKVSQVVDLLEELKCYRTAGTVEQLQKAAEKQIAKTPDYEGDGYADGELIYDTWICPNCGEHYEVGYDRQDYCPRCGQHIKHADWEDD